MGGACKKGAHWHERRACLRPVRRGVCVRACRRVRRAVRRLCGCTRLEALIRAHKKALLRLAAYGGLRHASHRALALCGGGTSAMPRHFGTCPLGAAIASGPTLALAGDHWRHSGQQSRAPCG